LEHADPKRAGRARADVGDRVAAGPGVRGGAESAAEGGGGEGAPDATAAARERGAGLVAFRRVGCWGRG